MPDPTPTTRDRELATTAYKAWAEAYGYECAVVDFEDDDLVHRWVETLAQARREGREEGLREAQNVVDDLRGEARIHHRADDPVPTWLAKASHRIAYIPDQPAPKGAEEQP